MKRGTGTVGQVGERAFLWTMVRNQDHHVVQHHVVGGPLSLVGSDPPLKTLVQQPDCQARAARKWLTLLQSRASTENFTATPWRKRNGLWFPPHPPSLF